MNCILKYTFSTLSFIFKVYTKTYILYIKLNAKVYILYVEFYMKICILYIELYIKIHILYIELYTKVYIFYIELYNKINILYIKLYSKIYIPYVEFYMKIYILYMELYTNEYIFWALHKNIHLLHWNFIFKFYTRTYILYTNPKYTFSILKLNPNISFSTWSSTPLHQHTNTNTNSLLSEFYPKSILYAVLCSNILHIICNYTFSTSISNGFYLIDIWKHEESWLLLLLWLLSLLFFPYVCYRLSSNCRHQVSSKIVRCSNWFLF